MKNILIVGAGLFGCTIAEQIANKLGKKVLLIDKRDSYGGNCQSYIDKQTNIICHKYGSHIFHTKDKEVFDYVKGFVELNSYKHQVLTRSNNKIYQMPINLSTINSFFNKSFSPSEARDFIEAKIKESIIDDPKNLEQKAISLAGKELYEAFIKGYTQKQWQRDPKELPAQIINRLPFRFSYDNNYFSDLYQGIPTNGYQELFDKQLANANIEIKLNCDFKAIEKSIDFNNTLIIYTAPIDELFDYKFGHLEYRSLDFEFKCVNVSDYQGTSVVNEADINVPYTRVHEFKHYHIEHQEVFNSNKTIICYEYSKEYHPGDERYYPVNTQKNMQMLKEYQDFAKEHYKNIIFGGRLGTYQYLDMDRVIRNALDCFELQIKPRLS